MSRIQHTLKTWPDPFQRIWDGVKKHEVRKTDRDFQVGDELVLLEYDPDPTLHFDSSRFTQRSIRVRVTYISMPGTFGLPAGTCVMSFEEVEREG